jgi:hypothetical protein
MSHYIQFAKNIYTQNGEDGIIEQLFKDLNIDSGVVVEFGAWDGVYLSNVYNLWKNRNFKAILIEGDHHRAKELEKISKKINRVESVHAFVSPDKNDPNSIDNILSRSSFTINNDTFALMSIDIDSCDYYVFESIERFLPKVIIIETNSSKTDEFVTYDQGCSLVSVNKLAVSKNYTLVCHTANAIFVRNDLMSLVPTSDYSVENLYHNVDMVDKLQKIGSNKNTLNEIYYLSQKYNSFIESERKSLL